jgi:hypothetical protein
MNRMETSEGQIIEVLPIGTKVRHKEHPELIGIIVHYEYHRSGKLSPLPYCVHWEDNALASKLLGWLFVYPSREMLEEG